MPTLSIIRYLIYAAGVYSIGFALFHCYFWKLFNWRKDLKNLSTVNKAIIQILNLRLIYVFFGIGIVCFVFPLELLSSKLGNIFLLGISLFWIGRTIEQFIFLKIKSRFVHVLTLLFIVGALLFAAPVILKLILFKPCIA